MGKQRRQERRQLDRARRSAGRSAEVADRAEASLAGLIDEITGIAAAQGLAVREVHLDRFESLRSSFLDKGYRWAPWCYLPQVVVGAGLGERLAIDTNPAYVSAATTVASVAAAWLPGRIAVRFDDDLAAALMATPLESTIPTDALHRLPAWGLYVDCPGLGRARGFFVALDSGRVEVPGRPPASDVDEITIVVVKDDAEGARHLVSTVWLQAGASIVDSMAAQERQRATFGPGLFEVSEEHWATEMGMPRAEALARILSLVLYLCSAGADVTQRAIPMVAGRRSAGPVTVVSAGFRVGAALRGTSEATRSHGGEPHRAAGGPALAQGPLAQLLVRLRRPGRPPHRAALGAAGAGERRVGRGAAHRRALSRARGRLSETAPAPASREDLRRGRGGVRRPERDDHRQAARYPAWSRWLAARKAH